MAIRNDTAKIERRYLFDMVDVTDQRILEIGCGDGRLTWQYANDTRHVVAIDVDLEELKEAHTARPDHLKNTVDFLAGSAIILPFASGSFDHVIFAWSF